MDAPPVQYVTTPDGQSIAYTVCGDGPTLVWIPVTLMNVRWTCKMFPEWYEGLAQRFRLVHFNYRGHGLSTRGLGPNHTMDDWLTDLDAVIRAVGGGPAALLAGGHAAHLGVRYAVVHPDRIRALVLSNTCLSIEAFPQTWYRAVAQENWPFFLTNSTPASGEPPDPKVWVERFGETVTREEHAEHMRAIRGSSIEKDAAQVTTPTLVLYAREFAPLPESEALKLTAAIPGAKLVVTDGAGYGNAPQGLAAIESFMGGLPQQVEPDPSTDQLLSHREAEVLRLIVGGKSNRDIAEELVISYNTVIRHVSNIYAKLGAANRAEAVDFAHRNGLLT